MTELQEHLVILIDHYTLPVLLADLSIAVQEQENRRQDDQAIEEFVISCEQTPLNGELPPAADTNSFPAENETPKIPTKSQDVRDGTYTVVFGDNLDDYRTVRIRTQPDDADFAPNERILAFLCGPDNERDFEQFGFLKPNGGIILWKRYRDSPNAYRLIDAVTAILVDPSEAGLAYAMKSGNCYICGRKLTVPASICRGIGPVCAAGA